MATRRRPPSAKAAGDAPPAAAGRDDTTEQALARSREIREKGRPQIQAARDYLAAARRRAGPSVRSVPVVQDPAARLIDASEQIERSVQARARLAALAAELVQTEETVAGIHDELAVRDVRHAARYRRAADDARQAASRAREIQADAARSDPG